MRLRAVNLERCIGCYSCMLACARYRFNSLSLTKCALHVKTHGGYENFVVVYCRPCPDPSCARACPTGALSKRAEGGVTLVEEKCNGCGQCAKACIIGALALDPETSKPLVCTHCGICARYCPHSVLQVS